MRYSRRSVVRPDVGRSLVRSCEADPDDVTPAVVLARRLRLPTAGRRHGDELVPLGSRLVEACDEAGVRPLAVRARLVFPAEFNELCETFGSKGAALSHVTIGLLREVVEAVRDEKCSPRSLKRARRSSPSATSMGRGIFTRRCCSITFPSTGSSRFAKGTRRAATNGARRSRACSVAFRMQGEEFLPTALASMTAKYLRELSMRAFNEFWCAHVPGLRPTAGYPADAPRFKQAIAAVQRELGIDDHVLWRNR